MSLESWGEIQAGGIQLGVVGVKMGFRRMAPDHLQAPVSTVESVFPE